MIRIAINGFGRIGRCILRAYYENPDFQKSCQIVVINDLSEPELLAHLTQYDSVHGIFGKQITFNDNKLAIARDEIQLVNQSDPTLLPWKDLNIDVVIECTGKFKSREQNLAHLTAGAKRVLIGHPLADADITVVYGVNHQNISPEHRIISNASCTTNCLAPVAKILNDAIGIEQGTMTTIHAYTNDQNLLDKATGDRLRARSAGLSMIPTRTGAAAAVGLVLPELAGRLSGMAVRVPTPNVSVIDLHLTTNRATSSGEINALMKEASTHAFKGVLAYNDLPLVSIDFNHNPASSIFDSTQTYAEGNHVKIMSWYDNEWGFSNRILDMVSLLAD